MVIRIVFGAVVLALPLQMVVRERWGEPYPGLYQPSFGGAPVSASEATTLEPDITVVGADGVTTAVSIADLLPPTPSLNTIVFRTAFYDADSASELQTRQWLRQRIELAAPSSDPEKVRIIWEDVKYDFVTGSRRVSATNRVVSIDVSASATGSSR